ncbi:MAG: tetratricopeptide repeat protein [Bacteroidetes bacterium]|nr:tetratricopeptide repeat protein [Bacteroidota bacterium]
MTLFKGLVLLLLLSFFQTTQSFSQPEVWKDSIDILLKEEVPTKNSIKKLNYYIAELWKQARVSDSTINQALHTVEKARQSGDELVLADALINLVRCYLNRYDSSKSLEYALEANKIYEKYGDNSKMAYTIMQLGVIYYTQNKYQKSLDYYEQAIASYKILADTFRLSTLYYLNGINNTRLRTYTAANGNFREALDLKLKLKDEQGIAEVNLGIAELKLEEKQPDSSLLYIDEAFKYILKSENKYGQAKAHLLKAKCFAVLNNFPQAFKNADLGLFIADSIDAKELVIDANEQLYKLYRNNESYPNAYRYLFNFMTMRDSIFNEKTSRSFSRLEMDYLLEKSKVKFCYWRMRIKIEPFY